MLSKTLRFLIISTILIVLCFTIYNSVIHYKTGDTSPMTMILCIFSSAVVIAASTYTNKSKRAFLKDNLTEEKYSQFIKAEKEYMWDILFLSIAYLALPYFYLMFLGYSVLYVL